MAEYREQVKHLREWTVLDIQNHPAHTIRMMRDAADTIEKLDAVPVVRCKDCKRREIDSLCEYFDDDDFCSHGERKDGDTDG